MIQNFAKADEDDKILSYTEELLQNPVLQNPMVLCENEAANSVLQYYTQQAAAAGIRTEVNFILPEECFIRPTDIVTVLGNLLKNGLEACLREKPSEPYIRVRGSLLSPSAFALMIENPSCARPYREGQSAAPSHNHEGSGLGLPSVRSVVDRYAGTMRIQQEQNTFRVSVILYSPAL